MNKKIALIISGLSSPFIVLPIVGLVAICVFSPSISDFIKWSIPYLMLPVLFPALYILIQVKRGKISDVHVAVREQRGMPFALAAIGAVLLLALYLIMGTPIEIVILSVVMLICAIVFGLITQLWKISIHAASWVGGVTLLSILVSINYLWLLLLLPLVIWGRLARGRHNIYQTLAAALVVSACVYSSVYLLLGNY